MINEEDYSKERTVQEFTAWIDQVNTSRQGTDQSYAYRDREGLWKKYADEAEPLGRFLRGNTAIPRTAQVKMGIQTDLPDAVVLLDRETIPIEITTTDHPGSVHNRRQLNDHGFGPGETNTVFTGRDLSARQAQGNPRDCGRAMSAAYMHRQELDRLLNRVRKKQEKSYPVPPLLIVDSCSSSLADIEETEVRDYLMVTNPPGRFREVWVCIFPGRLFRLG